MIVGHEVYKCRRPARGFHVTLPCGGAKLELLFFLCSFFATLY